MKTIELKLYSFSELSEEAKEKAFENFLSSERDFFWMDESLNSLKEGLIHFGFELKDWSIDYYCATNAYLKIVPYDEDVEELQGVRLWKYIHNNDLLKYWCAYQNKIRNLLGGNCPLTGYCVDEGFLDPIRSFIKKPTELTFKELMEECAHQVMKAIEVDYEYQSSMEFFMEECEANEREFLEDGSLY